MLVVAGEKGEQMTLSEELRNLRDEVREEFRNLRDEIRRLSERIDELETRDANREED